MFLKSCTLSVVTNFIHFQSYSLQPPPFYSSSGLWEVCLTYYSSWRTTFYFWWFSVIRLLPILLTPVISFPLYSYCSFGRPGFFFFFFWDMGHSLLTSYLYIFVRHNVIIWYIHTMHNDQDRVIFFLFVVLEITTRAPSPVKPVAVMAVFVTVAALMPGCRPSFPNVSRPFLHKHVF
jgi:hypothetical protein